MESSANPTENLALWYYSQLLPQQKKARSHGKILSRVIKLFLIPVGLYFILGLLKFGFAIYYYFDGYDFSSRFSKEIELFSNTLYFALVYGSLTWFIYLLSWEKINSLKVLKAKRKIFRLNHEDAPEFTNLIRSLAQRMDIPYARITLWSAITKNKFPSVEEDKMGEIHLVIPISFLRFFEENPGQAEAVLAHEFGHVLQKDTHLFHIADAYFDVIRSIWLPTAYLNIVLKILIMLWHIETVIMVMQTYMLLTCVVLGSFVFDVLVIRYMTKGFKDLRQSRRESEKLADIAACVFADASALNEVLSSENNEVAAITGKNDSVHPSKSERRKNIKHILQSTPV